MIPLLLLMTNLAVWGFPSARASAQIAPHAQLIEGAKKEGQLNWYTSMSVVDHTKYLELFSKKYPFIKVNVRRVGGERLITIITTEYRAGKTLFDVVISSGVAPSLIKSGIFAKYVSPEYQVFFSGHERSGGLLGRHLYQQSRVVLPHPDGVQRQGPATLGGSPCPSVER